MKKKCSFLSRNLVLTSLEGWVSLITQQQTPRCIQGLWVTSSNYRLPSQSDVVIMEFWYFQPSVTLLSLTSRLKRDITINLTCAEENIMFRIYSCKFVPLNLQFLFFSLFFLCYTSPLTANSLFFLLTTMLLLIM